MLSNAERQVEQEQFPAGILLAQAAVEMAATDAFISLIAREIGTPVDPVLHLVPDFSFMDKRTRTFWMRLTGTKITEPKEVWKAYHAHVERRSLIAHGQAWGDASGDQNARDSVAAASAFMHRMVADL